jgi:DNA-binding transcriptional MerR regulator
MWTLDELVERARAALAAEYSGAPNGRVRDLPDRRSIRWYAQTGLVDRPAGMRGRTALYGPRHLLQLVALKRRQAGGLSLAQIQAELTGATDAELAAIARVPEALLAAGSTPVDYVFPDAAPSRAHFWTTVPSPGTAAEMADPAARTGEAPAGITDPAPRTGGRRRGGPPARATSPAGADDAAQPVGGVALGGGAILVLPTPLTPADLAAVTAAAAPLMTLLAERGLLNHHHTGRAS